MAYDSAVISFTIKTDKVDLVQATHMNAVQSELVTIETILGTNVKGNRADLKTRLNNALDADGSILSGTSFPSPSLASQIFYRTDLNVLYMMNDINSLWIAQGVSLSNVIFCWNGADTSLTNTFGYYTGASLLVDFSGLAATYSYFGAYGTTYRTILLGKFTKISGISTITINARLWASSAVATNEAILNVDIGGQSNTVASVTSTTPTWVTPSTINVSSLTNGTTYDITIQIKSEGTASAYCGAVVLIAS
jgi:hypothetical protein